jgi:hypothetical protein
MMIEQTTKEDAMTKLTKQEELFFDRVALKMSADSSLTIETAAKAVLADDVKIVNYVCSMPDHKRRVLAHNFTVGVYHAIRAQA